MQPAITSLVEFRLATAGSSTLTFGEEMKNPSKSILIVIGSSVILILGRAVYVTLFRGTTSGPDFIQAVRAGHVTSDSISSIEVVDPVVGHNPFTAEEYASLPRRTLIDTPESIRRFLAIIADFEGGYVHLNHPSTSDRVYLRVNDAKGFYWLYGSVLQDNKRASFQLDANTRDAVNPNGGDPYHLDNFPELLLLLQQKKNTEQDVHGNTH